MCEAMPGLKFGKGVDAAVLVIGITEAFGTASSFPLAHVVGAAAAFRSAGLFWMLDFALCPRPSSRSGYAGRDRGAR